MREDNRDEDGAFTNFYVQLRAGHYIREHEKASENCAST